MDKVSAAGVEAMLEDDHSIHVWRTSGGSDVC